jgi:nicotinic acid mononucleotide adenylyltransferase
VIVVACGSYSPITIMHLRLLEDTRDAINTVSTASALALVFGSIVLAHTKSRE